MTAHPTEVTSTADAVDPDLYRFEGDGSATVLASRSDQTGNTYWPRRLRCPETGGTVTDVELAATGTVWSWTYVHAPWAGLTPPSHAGGYTAGLIDLDGSGPRIVGVLLGEQDDWTVGANVRSVPLPFRNTGDGVRCILAFERVTARASIAARNEQGAQPCT